MDSNTLIGVLAGFALSILLWLVTAKALVARISVRKSLYEKHFGDGRYEYFILADNTGFRDAVDVTVKCTLFSGGWGDGDMGVIATIAIPVSTEQIDIMAGTLSKWRDRKISQIGPRIVRLRFRGISDLQKNKLTPDQRDRLESDVMSFKELAELGHGSFLNVVVYASDRFSLARVVYRAQELTVADVQRDEATATSAEG